MMYAGDEFYDDEITSGPILDDDFDAERQSIQDEYDAEDETVSGYTTDQLIDLRDRMVRATGELDRLRNRAAALHNTTEYARLDGKLEGVQMALSYLDEMIGR